MTLQSTVRNPAVRSALWVRRPCCGSRCRRTSTPVDRSSTHGGLSTARLGSRQPARTGPGRRRRARQSATPRVAARAWSRWGSRVSFWTMEERTRTIVPHFPVGRRGSCSVSPGGDRLAGVADRRRQRRIRHRQPARPPAEPRSRRSSSRLSRVAWLPGVRRCSAGATTITSSPRPYGSPGYCSVDVETGDAGADRATGRRSTGAPVTVGWPRTPGPRRPSTPRSRRSPLRPAAACGAGPARPSCSAGLRLLWWRRRVRP